MTNLRFGSLLLAGTMLGAPAALAQSTTSPPAGQTVDPSPPQNPTAPEDPNVAADDPNAQQEEVIETSTPGAEAEADIVVVGRNIPNVVRATPQVVNVLSSADIARTGEGDIAGALQRVTGLSVVGNGFVFVRGLGDRYSSSLLNGSPLPSPEPLRRVVPLDIFPTNIIASSLVQKSYSVNYPGEFGGGVINLTTRAIPTETFLQIGGGVTFDTVTTSELGYVYDGGKYDTIGFDSGERTVPGFIKAAGASGADVTSTADLITLSNAPTTLLLSNFHIPANWSGELSFGTSFDSGDARFGVIGSAGISNSWRTRDAIQQDANAATGSITDNFRSVTTDNRVIVNGLLGFGAEFGDQKIRFTNLYIHDTLKQGRLARGTTANLGLVNGIDPVIDQNTNWFERQLIDTQFVGEFKFGELNADVRASYANTRRKSPYERAFRYEYNLVARDYVNRLDTGRAAVAFSDLNEDLYSAQADLAYELNFDTPIKLAGGYYYSDATRDSTRYQFNYRVVGNAQLNLIASQQRPDFLLSDSTIQRFNIYLDNVSGDIGAAQYDAKLRIHAGYAQVEGEITDGLRATAGVRYETGKEQVFTAGVLRTALDNDYWLPATTVTWNFAENQQVRLHASKTIARPQFRELAQQLYQDFESDRSFVGNPFLQDSVLYNFEARYEWFFGRDQRITLAGFYKKIEDPIEAIAAFPTPDSALQTGFANAPEAQLYGGEIELQKYFRLNDWFDSPFFATRRLLIIGNYTYTKSEISAGSQRVADPIQPLTGAARLQTASLLFEDGAPLVGQSDHLVNVQLGIEDTDTLSQLTFLFNYASERVTNRGPVSFGQRLPDIVEKPGIRFDIVARQGFTVGGAEFELKFEGRNLTKTRYQEYQIFANGNRVDVNTYDLGRVFSAGISARF